ncbi:MAG: SpoIVB peptidase [Clostridiales bacterium]|jgi:stage IV sporulation protein B|nr:SpoIVB peptidase [Clostridiales bacterium]
MKNIYFKRALAFVCVCVIVAFILVFAQLPLSFVDSLPNSVDLSYSDLTSLSQRNLQFDYNLLSNVNLDGTTEGVINVKAFGFFPIKRVKVKVQPNRKVFKGGQVIGISMSSNGVLVIDNGNVRTEQGLKNNFVLKKGDIIKKIDGKDILKVQNVLDYLKTCEGNNMSLTLERDGKLLEVQTQPFFDATNNEHKLGAWVKDKVAGLGTVSYIRLDGRFGALGHPVIDNDTNTIFPVFDGTICHAKVLGVNKGEQGKAGSLKGIFSANDAKIGNIHSNNKFGVFGDMTGIENEQVFDVGSRFTVKPGKAKIVSTVTDKADEYDIEIVKVINQKKTSDKSMVIKVTDKRLLEQTGGIVQGMSGSPIIQNDKVVGALTHVFLNDPTRGYGIYLDWMYEN